MLEFSMYSIGSGRFLREVFNAVAMLTGTGDFIKAVAIAMLFSVIVVCLQAVLRGGRSIAWEHVLLGFILFGICFGSPSRVIVEDVYTNDVYTVDNVPLGVAASGSMISKVGYGLTVLFETGFGSANRVTDLPYLSSLKYLVIADQDASSGFMLDGLSTETGVDVRASLGAYIKNCTVPALRIAKKDRASATQMNVQDLLKYGSEDNVKGSVIYYWGNGGNNKKEVTCKEAYTELNTDVFSKITNDNVSSILNNSLQSMNSGSTPNYQLTINDAFTYLDVSTQEQQNFALASIITPIFQYAYQHFYTRSEALADTMVAQALQQRNYQWVSEQSLWATVVMPLMTFFEGFVYAITPFCAMLFFYGMFGLGLIGKYLQTLFWINLWMPIMAICNLYISLSVSGQLQGINLGSMDGVSTAISTLQNQIATGGMLMTATPLLALMVVTGSTYAFTTLASRLNGGDHVDEKVMAPSSVKVGDVFDQQAFQQANRGAGHLSTGKQAVYENISFGQQVSSLISSSDQLVNSKMDNFIKTLSHNKSLAQEIGNTKSSIESNTDAFLDSFNHMSAADQARVYQDVVSGKIGAKMDIGGGVSAVLNMDRINKHVSASAVAGKLKGLGANLGLSGGINFSNQLSSTNSSNYRDSLQKGVQYSFARNIASANASQFSDKNTMADISSMQRAAGEVNQASQSFTAAQSLANSLNGSYSAPSNVLAKQIIDQIDNGGNEGRNMREALTQGEALCDPNAVRQRMTSMMSASGGFLDAKQARVAATLELLSDGTDIEKQKALCAIGAEAGKNQTTLGNYARYAGTLNSPDSPDSIGSVGFGEGEFAGYRAKAVQKIDSTVPHVNIEEKSNEQASDVINEASHLARSAHNTADLLRKHS
ncbi:conjugal transfer protein TraG N-terminal domain-containing protein [Turicimonas muris]|uniref:conjugal transfer protein TraG N-terminal domain-containing protein n=1 Tax=Turicimonas muris TaxID=1796652 RepID=UPI002493FD07|nr:conjugal transfer protein TraG N-terminal domain-containing protein [Turicimonas muris]